MRSRCFQRRALHVAGKRAESSSGRKCRFVGRVAGTDKFENELSQANTMGAGFPFEGFDD
jgi:hypothetical protein